MNEKPFFTREMLREGLFDQTLAEQTGIRLRDKIERETLRREFLRRVSAKKSLWVFAYGSLIGNPTFHYVERRRGRLHGYHRAFCIWLPLGRGSSAQPGLMMGLDRGGSCNGVLFRLAPEQVEAETELIWDREMLVSMYHPRWVRAKTQAGTVEAFTFLVNRTAANYAGRLTPEQQAFHIARADGQIGTNADYLFSLCHCFKAEGIRDWRIDQLRLLVEAEMTRRV